MSEIKKYHRDIMQYESKIWACADTLIACSIKQSDFPAYMMPFFALVMLEGRMLNKISEIEANEGITYAEDSEAFLEAFRDENCGYNEYIVKEGKTLSSVCDNDKTFEQDFRNYLNGFDANLKELLGIERGTDDSKYLNLDGIVAELRKKKVLMEYITGWAQIDLSPYNNSEITTLEEHIKRKWADISAETAGEQYTPEDIISLISEIVAAKIDIPKSDYVHLYDPTCGGANLLFGVSDRLRDKAGYQYIATFGQDFNNQLYALAKIESLFREDADIRYGNTLTQGRFPDKEFDVVVANPPYGITWKGFEKEVKSDQTGQFKYYPSISDGQLLFLQHNAAHLYKDKGLVVEVNNGSSLFSGDAGSGESNIRKYLFDNDWVEAIVQMPSDEFFNTGIVTYLWILNKNKPADRKDKVILINAADLWQPLKKNKGSKRKEMSETHRADIVRALVEFRDSDIAKVFNKWHFYYNKQQITLYEASKEGLTVKSALDKEPELAKPKLLEVVGPSTLVDETFDLTLEEAERLCNRFNSWADGETSFTLNCAKHTKYVYDSLTRNIRFHDSDGFMQDLGFGEFRFSIKKSRNVPPVCELKVTLVPVGTKDTEIIPYNPNPEENHQGIIDFLRKYVSKPFALGDNTVGVEVNFNKEFYVPETVEPVDSILAEIAEIDRSLADLENELGL